MADYWVTGIVYNADNSAITHLVVHMLKYGVPVRLELMEKATVINLIQDEILHAVFETAQRGTGVVDWGNEHPQVRVVPGRDGSHYLRSVANDIEEDNLGELPRV